MAFVCIVQYMVYEWMYRDMFENQVIQITSEMFKVPCGIQLREVKCRSNNQQFVFVQHLLFYLLPLYDYYTWMKHFRGGCDHFGLSTVVFIVSMNTHKEGMNVWMPACLCVWVYQGVSPYSSLSVHANLNLCATCNDFEERRKIEHQ